MRLRAALLVSLSLLLAPFPPAAAQQIEPPFFPETGYRIATPAFADYFAKRGGLRTFGYPVSNAFLFLGTQVQFFQRQIMQRRPDGSVGTLNILDADLMPYTRINGSTFPAADPAVLAGAPDPSSPNYAARILQFVADQAPNVWNGLPVGFRDAFLTTVRYEEAFPDRSVGPGIMPSINLELWGIPTSQPAADPSNAGFVYLRFQRGIMHFDSATGATQGLLLADSLKAIITGEGLPADLEADARTSRFYRQYDPTRPGALARPAELPGTDLTGAFGLVAQVVPAPTPVAQGPKPVPPELQPLYDQLKSNLDGFEAALGRQPIAPHRPLTLAAELSFANCNRGPALLEPDALDAVRLQLDALQSLGVQGATHCLHYPLLYSGYPDSARYLAFYKAVAAEIRKRGMKHAIDLQVIFSGSSFANLTVDYSDLTLDSYADRKAQMAQTIVDQIAPDYLSLGGEPDTEARLTGLRELNDPTRHTEFLQKVLAKIDRKTTKLGAGSGTWVPAQFVRSYAASTSIDFVDIHIYPIGPAIVTNTLQMADIARQFNKPVVIYEAWLYKTVGGESQDAIAGSETVYARDAYTFWQPLDQRFMRDVVALANLKQMDYVSLFWSMYFFGQLDYSPSIASLRPEQVIAAASQAALRGMEARSPTPLGELYRSLIAANRR